MQVNPVRDDKANLIESIFENKRDQGNKNETNE